jgi:hypothetical protein
VFFKNQKSFDTRSVGLRGVMMPPPLLFISDEDDRLQVTSYTNVRDSYVTDSNTPPQSKLAHTRFRLDLNRSSICRVAGLVNTSVN